MGIGIRASIETAFGLSFSAYIIGFRENLQIRLIMLTWNLLIGGRKKFRWIFPNYKRPLGFTDTNSTSIVQWQWASVSVQISSFIFYYFWPIFRSPHQSVVFCLFELFCHRKEGEGWSISQMAKIPSSCSSCWSRRIALSMTSLRNSTPASVPPSISLSAPPSISS